MELRQFETGSWIFWDSSRVWFSRCGHVCEFPTECRLCRGAEASARRCTVCSSRY